MSPVLGERRSVRRALVSVHDKSGLERLVKALHEAGVSLVSGGSTAELIEAAGIPCEHVDQITGFPGCLDGEIRTVHPTIYAAILADTENPSHMRELTALDIEPFDLVVGNFFSFAGLVVSSAPAEESVRRIDFAGPALMRAAVKNHRTVAILSSPEQYPAAVEAISTGGFTLQQRQRLAAQAMIKIASHDVAQATWMSNQLADTTDGTGFPEWVGRTWTRDEVLRYGENPHQQAALYSDGVVIAQGLAQADVLHGKAMSYNNYVDADAAVRAAYDHGEQPCCAIVKHNNPCGIAVGADIAEAHRKAHACDPLSAYGGVVATNMLVSVEMARTLSEIFTEVVAAPGFEDEAYDILSAKKNVRLVRVAAPRAADIEQRPVSGGMLLQTRDRIDAEGEDKHGNPTGDDPTRWRLVAGEPVDERTMADLEFAWRAVRAVKSNAILLADDGASVGVGMGQVNRVDSARLAVERAGAERARGAVASSDAFFPFADGLQVLMDAGVRAVVAPGGSIHDPEVIEAAQQGGIALYFTGTRHFAH